MEQINNNGGTLVMICIMVPILLTALIMSVTWLFDFVKILKK